MEIQTYTSKDDYELIKGVNLDLELKGSTDHNEKAPLLTIYDVEQKMIRFLKHNYAFEEKDIRESEESLQDFKLAVCEQVSYILREGGDGDIICKSAKVFLRPFMIWRCL